MNESIRSKIYNELFESLSDYYRDRHTIRDIVLYGLNFKGLSYMTDQELLDEYRNSVLCSEEDDELAKEAEAAIAIEQILTEKV
jgi:hypothetical protein